MTYLKDIRDEKLKNNYLEHTKELQKFWAECRNKTLDKINSYLFSLNTGALLVSLTYLAAKENNADIMLSIWGFVFGLLLCVLHAVMDYYISERCMIRYGNLINKFYKNEIVWNDFINKSSSLYNKKLDLIMHMIGWISAFSFISALIWGVIQLN